jgi:hypothetical protein
MAGHVELANWVSNGLTSDWMRDHHAVGTDSCCRSIGQKERPGQTFSLVNAYVKKAPFCSFANTEIRLNDGLGASD